MNGVCGVLDVVRNTWRQPMAGGAALLAGSQYASVAVSLLATAFAARLLGPADYGLAAVVMSYPALVVSLVSIRSYSVTLRYLTVFLASGEHAKLRGMCKLGYTLDFAVAVLAFVLVSTTGWRVAGYIAGTPEVAWLMVAYAASFPFASLLGTSWAVLMIWQRFHLVATLQILDKAVASALAIALLLAGFGIPGVVLGTAVGNALVGCLATVAANALLSREGLGPWWRASISAVRPLQKEIAAFFGWTSLIATWGGIMAYLPVMLLGRLRGPEEAGFFRLATSITATGSYLENSLGRVAFPILTTRWALGERTQLAETLKRWTLRGGLPVCAAVLLMIPFLSVAIPKVFGASYAAMVQGTQVLMASVAVSAPLFWLTSFYFASARLGLWAKAYGLYTLVAIGLGWFFIEQWGFFGLTVIMTIAKLVFLGSMTGLLLITGSPLSPALVADREALTSGSRGQP